MQASRLRSLAAPPVWRSRLSRMIAFGSAPIPLFLARRLRLPWGCSLASVTCLNNIPAPKSIAAWQRISPDDDSGEITSEDYQFSIADWELEGLTDNIVLSGSLYSDADGLALGISLDKSFLDDTEVKQLNFHFVSLPKLIDALPSVSAEIMRELGSEDSEPGIITYGAQANDSQDLARLLESVFEWNLDAYLYLWDVEWDEADVRAQVLEIAETARQLDSEFAYWCLGMIAKQVMQAGVDKIGELLLPLLDTSLSQDSQCAPGAAAIALGLSDLEQIDRAAALLQPYLRPNVHASIWLSMIEILLAGGRLSEAIETNQLALENGLTHAALYWQYAQLLMTAEANEWNVEDVLLIDPDEFDEDEHIAVEIASALKLHVNGNPGNLSALQLALAYMIDTDDDELWLYFERLIERDRQGAFAGEIIDRIIDIDDHDAAYEILERHAAGNRYARVFTAQLALADGDIDLATATIEACRNDAPLDDDLELELQRLELYARLPKFAETFADIKLTLNAKRQLDESKVDLLEAAIAIAPKLVDLYVILSRSYLNWSDSESALEVLMDAEREAGQHPQIGLGQAQILWSQNQQEAAIEKLNAGLLANPGDIYLLVQMANYLLVNDQLDDAREFIRRAESIAPSHRAIWQVRRLVAQKMAERA